jgi:hypothetical protein
VPEGIVVADEDIIAATSKALLLAFRSAVVVGEDAGNGDKGAPPLPPKLIIRNKKAKNFDYQLFILPLMCSSEQLFFIF